MAAKFEKSGHLCCAFLAYEEAARMIPAESALSATRRLERTKSEELEEAANQCRELQYCTPTLLTDIRELIEAAREQTARAVNSALVVMYWRIGRRIRQDVVANDRAEYGEKIVQALSAQLTADFGRGFHPDDWEEA